MQPWQIQALELEASGFKHLDGYIHEHALGFFIGAIYLLLALLAWVLSGALRCKGGKSALHVRPGLFTPNRWQLIFRPATPLPSRIVELPTTRHKATYRHPFANIHSRISNLEQQTAGIQGDESR